MWKLVHRPRTGKLFLCLVRDRKPCESISQRVLSSEQVRNSEPFVHFSATEVSAVIRIERQRVERAARMYPSTKDASQALGITMRSFGRLCRKYSIETPYAKRCRRIHQYSRE